MELQLKFRETKNVTVIDIEGRIDLNASELIELVGWLLKRGKRRILLNFERVELMDYHGLSILAVAYKNVRNHDGIMKFVYVPLHIEKVFQIAQLLDVFELHEDENRAVESFHRKPDKAWLPHMRRRFRRLEGMSLRVRFIPVYRKGDPFFEGKAIDLGGEGLFLYAEKTFPLNTELSMELEFEPDTPPFTANGVVIWHTDRELQPQKSPGMGIQFKQLDANQQKRLIDFIDRNLVQRSG